MTPIPKTRAEQIALRDRLNALIDNPGADDAPFVCDVDGDDRLTIRHSRVRPTHVYVIAERENDPSRHVNVRLTPSEARRLAARILYLADNPEAE